jgi:hypothetical protein
MDITAAQRPRLYGYYRGQRPRLYGSMTSMNEYGRGLTPRRSLWRSMYVRVFRHTFGS